MKFSLQYLRPHAARLAAYLSFVVLSVVFTMATALSVADFLRLLFPSDVPAAVPASSASLLSQGLQALYTWLIAFGPRRALLYFSLILFALYAVKNLFSYLAAVQMSVVRCKVVRNIRTDLFRKTMRLPLSFYASGRQGDTLARFANDIVEYDEGSLASLSQLVTAVVSMVLYLAMLFYISPRLTLFALCMLPVIVFVISGITHRLRRSSRQLQSCNAFLTALMEETIMGLKVIKAYTAIDFSNRRFRQADQAYARLRTKVLRRIDLSSPVSDFLGNCVVIGILLFGSMLVLRGAGGLTADLFVSYIMLFVLMIPPAKELTTAVSQLKKGRACVERLQALLLLPDDPAYSLHGSLPFPAAPTPLQQPAYIRFSNLSFSYSNGPEVLHDVSLDIPYGATVALVGSSGSGKSTLASLLMSFHQPTAGQILLAGRPLQSYSLGDLRRHVGLVAQDTMLFNDTVRANIAFGLSDATFEQVTAAARAANAHDFVLQLPQGYDTPVGDGGATLSGGQRQRLSIARALLLSPDVLILDEATSALDTQSERLVQQALDGLLRHRTALVIAHRLSTVRNAHLIVVLEQGRIVEQGTHDQLMALSGRYYQLVQMQNFAS